MLRDMGHSFARGEPVYDIAFENVQAGPDGLSVPPRQPRRGFVIGTGDLSELALGWCTYGVGDQIAIYTVNAGVPKTLIQYPDPLGGAHRPVRPRDATQVLEAILATGSRPSSSPTAEGEAMQRTEATIGPYELHDFFLHHIMRYGHAPSKVAFLALSRLVRRDKGLWPIEFPQPRAAPTTWRRSSGGSRSSLNGSSRLAN